MSTYTISRYNRHAIDEPDDDNDDSRLSHGVVLAIMEAPLHRPEAVDRDGDEGEDRRERHAVVEEDPKPAENLLADKTSTSSFIVFSISN